MATEYGIMSASSMTGQFVLVCFKVVDPKDPTWLGCISGLILFYFYLLIDFIFLFQERIGY